MYRLSIIVLLIACLGGCGGDGGLIDRQEVFDRYDWWDSRDWGWYAKRIPFIETPDAEINEVYYYRWEVMKTHLTYGSPETGYLFTEFMDRPFWSGTYGGISCPLGHQLSEVRWLKDPRVIDDFSRYWIDTEGARPRTYSNWYGTGLWQVHEVWGDEDWVRSMLPYMEEQYQGWRAENFDQDHGLFFKTGHDDGMEVNINSRQAEDDWVVEGYRPTLNAYLYGDLLALSKTSALAGDTRKAARYAAQADTLKRRVLEELWDERRQFFLHQFKNDHPPGIVAKTRTYQTGPYAGDAHGRELIGYVPWQFNLPEDRHAVAWQFLMDPDHFYAPFGPTTTEQGDPQFYVSERCCVWSGQSWPYATTQTLVALANLLNNYRQEYVSAADYVDLLKVYTRTQYKDGRPYIAESANPHDGSWFGSNMPNHSEHYLHSGYVDLVLSGLLGIRAAAGDTLVVNPLVPDAWDYFAVEGVAYHGYELSLVWDRDGSRYGKGVGLTLLLDGQVAANKETLGPLTHVVASRSSSMAFERPNNLAVNNGRRFPEITASFSAPSHPPFAANDGAIYYHKVPTNRWTTAESPNDKDWLAIDFGATQTVSEVKLYFLDDEAGIVPPADFTVEVRVDGAWIEAQEQARVPGLPTGRRANTVSLGSIEADGMRVTFTHAKDGFTGLTELEVWTPSGIPVRPPDRAPSNRAINPDGAAYPRISASFPPDADVSVLIDGSYGLTTYQANRWIARDTPNDTDWVQIDFESRQTISMVDVYLWGDAPRYLARIDSSVTAPRSLKIEVMNGSGWEAVSGVLHHPVRPMTMARNRIFFDAVEAQALRVLFEHDGSATSGATEIQVW